MRGLLASDELTASYISIIPCVETFVATQLDHRSPGGEAGPLGPSREAPRLGSTFRKTLAKPAARKMFGPLIEAQVRGGFAGAAAAIAAVARPGVATSAERRRWTQESKLHSCQSFWIEAGAALSCELTDPPPEDWWVRAAPVDPCPGSGAPHRPLGAEEHLALE